MKILFGVQGTGNGHISRARMMARHFSALALDVDYLFSGREANAFFDMETFGDYQYRKGLTFASKNGKVSYSKTAISNNIPQFFKDAKNLDLSSYDKIITDFEPVTAWAAKLAKKEVLGIGHQYAFGHNVPRAGSNPIADLTIKNFAPATQSLGLHWHHFDATILPPIIDPTLKAQRTSNGRKKIVVYLPFENQNTVQKFLQQHTDFDFYIYSPELTNEDKGHLYLRKTSYAGFKKDLSSAHGVISNSGFELISECLFLGLQVLTKPQQAQMEQQSNAAALEQLGYATTMQRLESSILETWLAQLSENKPINYPDVAKAIVEWISNGCQASPQQLCHDLWENILPPNTNK